MTGGDFTREPWRCAGCGSESVAQEQTCGCPTSCLYRQTDAGVEHRVKEEKIGPWRIWHDPPPIGTRDCDWHYQHEDTDLDCPAWMHGSRPSRQACIEDIIDGYEDRIEALSKAVQGGE